MKLKLNITLAIIIAILLSSLAYAAFNPRENIDGQDYFNISGFLQINGTNIFQNGSQVLDAGDINDTIFNYSSYANSTDFWDGLDTPLDISLMSSVIFDNITTNYTDFNPQASMPYKEGRLFYDDEQKTLVYYNDEAGVSVNIGEESLLRAKNNQGETIYNGDVVYIDGATGDNPTVKLAKADNISTSRVIGMVTQDSISNNGVGYVTTFGRVRGLDTSAYSVGQDLYVSPSSAGDYVTYKPIKPNISFRVGSVVRSHSTEGVIFVDNDREINNFNSGRAIFSNGNGELSQDAAYTYNSDTETLTATNIFQDGNKVLDSSDENNLNVNSSNYWDNKDTAQNISLDELQTVVDANKRFDLEDKTLEWLFNNPNGGMLFNFTGGASGHLVEMVESGGSPAGTHLLHLETTDDDTVAMHLTSSGNGGTALLVDEGKVNLTGSNDIDTSSINVNGNLTANNLIGSLNASYVDNFDIAGLNDYYYANTINMSDESVTYVDGRSLFAELGGDQQVTISGENITSGTVSSNYIEDAYVENTGDTMTGNLDMGGNDVTNVNNISSENIDTNTVDTENISVGNRHGITELLGIADKEYEWDNTNSDPAVTVEGDIQEYIKEVRVVTLADDGTVNSVCADYENQTITCETNGSDGQVMVEFPKLYYKETKDGSGNLEKVEISEFDLPGFKLHPAFSWGEGRNRDYVYIGAFEASYDGSSLASVSGEPTRTDRTIAQYRDEAAARYTGNQTTSSWHPIGFWQRNLVELLWYSYYETRNSQESQPGYTEASSYDASYKRNTGRSINCTTHNCSVTADLDGTDSDLSSVLNSGDKIANRFLWVENVFGHIWKFTDGVTYVPTETVGVSAGWNGDYQAVYTTADPRKFSSDNAEIYNNYEKLPVTPYAISGEDSISKVGAGFVPTAGGASSSTYWTDNYWSFLTDDTRDYLRAVRAGGDVNFGGKAGVASRASAYGLGPSSSSLGSRLCYSKI